MKAAAAITRTSVVDELTRMLRDAIVDGDFAPGARLREIDVSTRYGVSRHTVRAALQRLAGDGLVEIRPQRGARIATLDPERLASLFELRTALEIEAAHLALERHDGRLPTAVHDALAVLTRACTRPRSGWSAVTDAHMGLHRAIVTASGSPRIIDAYDSLADELRLFVMHLRPVWDRPRMVAHHKTLIRGLERLGTDVLREHIREGRETALAGPAPVQTG